MYAVIRHYKFDPKNTAKIDQQIKEDFAPMLKKAPGFVAYYWLNTGAGAGASCGVFQSKAGADESVRLAADFVSQHMAGLLGKPEIIEGEVKAQG